MPLPGLFTCVPLPPSYGMDFQKQFKKDLYVCLWVGQFSKLKICCLLLAGNEWVVYSPLEILDNILDLIYFVCWYAALD